MNLRHIALGALPLCAGLLLAQDTTQTPASASSQSWTGLLVASTCTAGTGMASSTPGANREHNTTYEQTTNQADRNAVASSAADPTGKMATTTGTADRMNDANTKKPATGADATGYTGSEANRSTAAGNTANNLDAWAGAEKAAGQLDQSCRISAQTTSFALRTQDGTVVPFDAAANTRIAQQLQTGDRLLKKTKIFRVEVKGTMQDGAIVVDTIRL
jgi:hypothetical protein